MKRFEVNGYIDSYSINELISEIKKLDINEDIEIKVNSGGGEVFPAIKLYNYLKNERKGNVTTIADTLVASAGTIILYAGTKVKAYENTLLMYHSPSSLVWGDASEMREEAELLDKIENIIENIYNEKTGKNEKQILNGKDRWLTVNDAVAGGFIDETITQKQKKEDGFETYKSLVACFDNKKPYNIKNKKKMENIETKTTEVKETKEVLNENSKEIEGYSKEEIKSLLADVKVIKDKLNSFDDLKKQIDTINKTNVSINDIIKNYESEKDVKESPEEKKYEDYTETELDNLEKSNPLKFNELLKQKTLKNK